jgi:hypothetical protein
MLPVGVTQLALLMLVLKVIALFAVAFTVLDAKAVQLLLLNLTVYAPACVAGWVLPVAPVIGFPFKNHW